MKEFNEPSLNDLSRILSQLDEREYSIFVGDKEVNRVSSPIAALQSAAQGYTVTDQEGNGMSYHEIREEYEALSLAFEIGQKNTRYFS